MNSFSFYSNCESKPTHMVSKSGWNVTPGVMAAQFLILGTSE